jgi:hypothetical protein
LIFFMYSLTRFWKAISNKIKFSPVIILWLPNLLRHTSSFLTSCDSGFIPWSFRYTESKKLHRNAWHTDNQIIKQQTNYKPK